MEISGFLKGEVANLDNLVLRTGISEFEEAAEAGFYARQLIRLSNGKKLKVNMNPFLCSNFFLFYELKMAISKKIK